MATSTTSSNPYALKGSDLAAYGRQDWNYFNQHNKNLGTNFNVSAMQASYPNKVSGEVNNGNGSAAKPPVSKPPVTSPTTPAPGQTPYPEMPDYASQIGQLQDMMNQLANRDPWGGFFEKLQQYQAQQEKARKEQEGKFDWNRVLYGASTPNSGFGGSGMGGGFGNMFGGGNGMGMGNGMGSMMGGLGNMFGMGGGMGSMMGMGGFGGFGNFGSGLGGYGYPTNSGFFF